MCGECERLRTECERLRTELDTVEARNAHAGRLLAEGRILVLKLEAERDALRQRLDEALRREGVG